MLTDIEIANQAKPFKISRIAAKLNLTAEDIEPYGKYKAKLSRAKTAELASRTRTARPIATSARLSETQAAPVPNGSHSLRTPAPRGTLILVTALTPTPAGEGKSTVSIGLADALQRLKKRVVLSLREPSLGPCFGIKGGAAGGGRSQIVPMDEINLNFTGDIHAITAANNLLAAMIDNHIKFGNGLGIAKVFFKRCVDLNDRALREVRIGLGGKANGIPRTDGFNISVASEIMAILCLAEDLADLKSRLNQIVIGETSDGTPVYARDLNAAGAMAAILKDAVLPNLVQTLEHTPAFVHGGPFANIAHGTSSVIAARTALALADYVVTEAGFGADLGAEKFFDIFARKSGLYPDAVVLVATVRALKMHGGVAKTDLNAENLPALEAGFANLRAHIANLRRFGAEPVVAVNRFVSDTPAELKLVQKLCRAEGVETVVSEGWGKGGKGCINLAKSVLNRIELNRNMNSAAAPLSPSAVPASPVLPASSAGTPPLASAPMGSSAGTPPLVSAPMGSSAGTPPLASAPMGSSAGTPPLVSAPMGSSAGTPPLASAPQASSAGTSPLASAPQASSAGTPPPASAPQASSAGTPPPASAPMGSSAGSLRLLYPDALPLADKIRTVARGIYGAGRVTFTAAARRDLAKFTRWGYGRLPVCIAKTQNSISHDKTLLGAPRGYTFPITEVRLSAGAGFVVALSGEINTMPGLPRHPAAENIDVDENGIISGLF